MIINDVLDLSRIEADRITLEARSFSPESVFEQVRVMVAAEAITKQIELTLHLDSLPALLIGDSTRFGQILLNLVGNAVKFTDNGSVSILCQASSSGENRILLHIEVRDTGIGLTTEQISRIFRNFEQADPSTTRRFGGTGLGLAISKRLAELMGGTIGVESEAGRGSCFRLDIPFSVPRSASQTTFRTALRNPCSEPADSSAEPDVKLIVDGAPDGSRAAEAQTGSSDRQTSVPSSSQRSSPLTTESQSEEAQPAALGAASPLSAEKRSQLALRHGARILLAEDNDINREVFVTLLESMGLSVTGVANGQEALGLTETGMFDLIFMDIQMPVLGGLEATRAIRQLPHHHRTPILALTANAFEEDKKNCLAAGMNEHLAKPVDLRGFTEAVLRWIPPKNSAAGQCSDEESGSGIPAETSTEAAAVLESLSPIPGIDERAGLRSTGGDRALFLRLVQRFGESHCKDASLIAQAFEMGDLAELKLRTHTLKGVAATVGALHIRDLAIRIEQNASHDAGTEEARKDIVELQTSMSSLCEAIARMSSGPTGHETSQSPALSGVDCPDPEACIHELACLLAESNALALRRFQILRECLIPILGDSLPAIERHIRNFDFDEALRLLQEVIPPSMRLTDISSCESDAPSGSESE
jgi:two-component system sensor histidine kinase/response regulator